MHGGRVLVGLLLRGRSGGAVVVATEKLFTRDNRAADAGEQTSIVRQAEKLLVVVVVAYTVPFPDPVLVVPQYIYGVVKLQEGRPLGQEGR